MTGRSSRSGQRSHPSPSLGCPKLSPSPSPPPCCGITHGVAVGLGFGRAVGTTVGAGVTTGTAVAGTGDGVAIGVAVVAGVLAGDGAEAAAAPPQAARPNVARVDSKSRRERMATVPRWCGEGRAPSPTRSLEQLGVRVGLHGVLRALTIAHGRLLQYPEIPVGVAEFGVDGAPRLRLWLADLHALSGQLVARRYDVLHHQDQPVE